MNGVPLQLTFDCPPEIRAIQWNGETGHIEYNDGRMPEKIYDEMYLTPYIGYYETEINRINDEKREREYNRLRDPTARKEELASIRYDKETGSVTVSGLVISLDTESKAKIGQLVQRLQISTIDKVNFKSGNGWIELTSNEVITLASKLGTYVQSLFDYEKVMSDQIDRLASTPDELAKFDLTSGWPDTIIA